MRSGPVGPPPDAAKLRRLAKTLSLMPKRFRLVIFAVLSLAVLNSCSSNCRVPDESSSVRHHLPIGFSFSYPEEWAVEELHQAVWMRNYCKPSIWLSAGYYQTQELGLIPTDEAFLRHVEEGLARVDRENRFHPLGNSSEIVNVGATLCVRSTGKLEEHSTQSPGEVLNYIDHGDLQCLHPEMPGTIIHLFYWVQDNRKQTMSPQQKVGELFLDSLKLEDRDNKAFNTDPGKAGAG